MRSKIATLRNHLAMRGHKSHLLNRHTLRSTRQPYGYRRSHSGNWWASIALLLTSLLAWPLLGWCVERLLEHLPHLEEMSTQAHRSAPDPLRLLLTRETRADAMVCAPKTLAEGVLSRIEHLSSPPQEVTAPVVAVPWPTPQPWPALADGALVRPAGVVLAVLWVWSLAALWVSCLLGLVDPTLALRVIETLVSIATRALAVLQGIGTLVASAGANIPMTAGLSLLVLALGLGVWMVIARQFTRYVLGA